MAADRPNIILFTTDQHRGDHIGLAGHPVVETPNLDAFVGEGAYFPNAYSEIPSTTGARRVMHGGQANYACGLIGYAGTEWHEPNTLAAVLAQAGYHCLNIGWRNMHPRRKLYGFHSVIPHDLRKGDDDYWDWLERELGPHAHERTHGSDANGWLGRPWPYEERFHPTNWTVDVTIDQIEKRDPTRPFFVWCSHLRPHSPYDPPQFFWDMYYDRELPPIPVGDWAKRFDTPTTTLARTAWHGRLSDANNQRMRAGYMGCISHIDYQLGYLMERLNRVEAGRNTMILFTSDHGDMMSDHHLHRKSYAFEGSARIPFVIKYSPGLDLPTGTFEHPVGLQDVMPTLLEAANVDVPDSVTGESVLKAIRGEPWRDVMHGEHSPCYSKDMAMQYLTDGREKYIWYPCTGDEQFFDLVQDRQELKNLAADPANELRVAPWRQRLIELLGKRGDGFSDGRKLLVRPERYGPEAVAPTAKS
ncbi:MAG: arylsulfatase [Lentisphaeria bacterium]|nr:arylsulfatase [Lentisphaeria bacterium]